MLVFILVFYSLWFLLTVIVQLRKFDINISKKIKTADYFKMFPLWSLFAPRPMGIDYILFYRDRAGDTTSAFKEIKINETKWGLKFIFNPNQRIKAALSRIFIYLSRQVKQGKAFDEIKASMEYNALLNYVKRHDSKNGIERQFAIYGFKGFKNEDKPFLVLTSDFHYVD